MLSMFFEKIQNFFRNRFFGLIMPLPGTFFLHFSGLESRQGFSGGCFRPVSALRG
jgi:hypothetical protein